MGLSKVNWVLVGVLVVTSIFISGCIQKEYNIPQNYCGDCFEELTGVVLNISGNNITLINATVSGSNLTYSANLTLTYGTAIYDGKVVCFGGLRTDQEGVKVIVDNLQDLKRGDVIFGDIPCSFGAKLEKASQ